MNYICFGQFWHDSAFDWMTAKLRNKWTWSLEALHNSQIDSSENHIAWKFISHTWSAATEEQERDCKKRSLKITLSKSIQSHIWHFTTKGIIITKTSITYSVNCVESRSVLNFEMNTTWGLHDKLRNIDSCF